jgi:hypothetical protein
VGGDVASRRRVLSDMWAQLNRHNIVVVLISFEDGAILKLLVWRQAVWRGCVMHRNKVVCDWLPRSSIRIFRSNLLSASYD